MTPQGQPPPQSRTWLPLVNEDPGDEEAWPKPNTLVDCEIRTYYSGGAGRLVLVNAWKYGIHAALKDNYPDMATQRPQEVAYWYLRMIHGTGSPHTNALIEFLVCAACKRWKYASEMAPRSINLASRKLGHILTNGKLSVQPGHVVCMHCLRDDRSGETYRERLDFLIRKKVIKLACQMRVDVMEGSQTAASCLTEVEGMPLGRSDLTEAHYRCLYQSMLQWFQTES